MILALTILLFVLVVVLIIAALMFTYSVIRIIKQATDNTLDEMKEERKWHRKMRTLENEDDK